MPYVSANATTGGSLADSGTSTGSTSINPPQLPPTGLVGQSPPGVPGSSGTGSTIPTNPPNQPPVNVPPTQNGNGSNDGGMPVPTGGNGGTTTITPKIGFVLPPGCTSPSNPHNLGPIGSACSALGGEPGIVGVMEYGGICNLTCVPKCIFGVGGPDCPPTPTPTPVPINPPPSPPPKICPPGQHLDENGNCVCDDGSTPDESGNCPPTNNTQCPQQQLCINIDVGCDQLSDDLCNSLKDCGIDVCPDKSLPPTGPVPDQPGEWEEIETLMEELVIWQW